MAITTLKQADLAKADLHSYCVAATVKELPALLLAVEAAQRLQKSYYPESQLQNSLNAVIATINSQFLPSVYRTYPETAPKPAVVI